MSADETATLRQGREPRARRAGPALVHLFSEGAASRDDPVAVRGEVVIGRDADCAIALDDDAVSRRHARVWRDGAAVWVEDLGSHNGTRLGGRDLKARAPIEPADLLRVGRSLFALTTEPERFTEGWREAREPLVGGPAMRELGALCERFGPTPLPVLLLGETGTGKELVAREIHRASGRTGEFVAVNCAAVPANMFEAELFGYRRGAFTGAASDKRGLLVEASGGTLLLDEVGELSQENQARLLRAIETGEVRALGATRTEKTDARVIAATNRALDRDVASGRFREDLYHRLRGVVLFAPPLRERPEDVPMLAMHALRREGGAVALGADACEALLCHRWPGNVRELLLCVRAAAHCAAAEGRRVLLPKDLPPAIAAPESAPRDQTWERVARALHEHGGNVSRAAKALGLHRAQVYEHLRRSGRRAAEFRDAGLD